METKTCRKCKKEKYLLDFTITKKGTTYSHCKECNVVSKMKNTTLEDPKRRTSKSWELKRDFNIDIDEYDRMLSYQNYKCAICRIPASMLKIALAVDHCHKTGKIRKLLCTRCNLTLGSVEDNIELLENMIKYLTIFEALNKLDG